MSGLEVRPCSIRFAKKWVKDTHRKLPDVQGALWAVAALRDGEVIGCAIVGHAACAYMKRDILSVLRVAVLTEQPNACSKLYGACSRAARAMGAAGLVTYTHQSEPGTSLIASGWRCDGLTRGGEHARENRPRKPAKDPSPKWRWFAPWSVQDNVQSSTRKTRENRMKMDAMNTSEQCLEQAEQCLLEGLTEQASVLESVKKKPPAPAPASARFSHFESDRYSAIQRLATKYYACDVNGGWLSCVARAREEVDSRA